MITKKDLLKNVELLKKRLSKNEIKQIKGEDFIYNSPIFWVDKDKDIYFYMVGDRLIFQNK